MRTLEQANLRGKRVLVRVDYNVPEVDGKITDINRIAATLPTLRFILMRQPAQVLLVTHWGRPEGEEIKWRLYPVAEKLLELLKKHKIGNSWPAKIKKFKISSASPVLKTAYQLSGNLILLENVRFDSREEANGEEFAKELAKLADVYIDDSFATVHRRHASIVAIARFLPAYGGLLVKEEIRHLAGLAEKPSRPFVAVIGGVKLEDKLPAAIALLKIADHVLVGGKVGLELISRGETDSLILPIDGVTAVGKLVRLTPEMVAKETIFDLGPETIQLFKAYLKDAKTIFWNGCLGKVEDKKFVHGSFEIARFIVRLKAQTVASGGDTIGVISRLGISGEFDFISTGGGATLKFLAGDKLPGLEALEN